MNDADGAQRSETHPDLGLIPATTYGFEVQALGPIGYSDWSTTETIICI